MEVAGLVKAEYACGDSEDPERPRKNVRQLRMATVEATGGINATVASLGPTC